MVSSFNREAVKYNKPEIIKFLEPQQLALSNAGAAMLINSVRMILEVNPDFVVVQIDMANAYNA